MENVVRKKPLGIVSLKEMLNSIENAINEFKGKVSTAIDNADTKRAERKYEKIRKELLHAGTKYTEKEYNECAELLAEAKNLSANDRLHLRDSVRRGKEKEDGKNRRRAAISIVAGLAETGIEMATGQSVVGAVLGTFGVTAPPATTLIAGLIAAGTAFYSLYKLNKSKNFTEAERLLTDEEFRKDFSAMVEEVKTLCAELDKAKSENIKDLKAINGKKMSAKDFKKAFAMSAYKIIHNMNLQYLNKENVTKVFGIEKEVAEFEAKQKEQQASQEAAEKASVDEEKRILAEQEEERIRKEIEEKRTNIERGQE